jgi:hypothetical protein
MRLRGWLALSLTLFTGCQAWHIERPLPARLEVPDIRTGIAPPGELAEVQELSAGCYDHLRALMIESSRIHRSHVRNGLIAMTVANAFTLGVSIATRPARRDPFLGSPETSNGKWRMFALGVNAATFSLVHIDLTFHPSVRAARARNTEASRTWIGLRRVMNRWESAARDWDLAMSQGDSVRASTARALWRAEDGEIRETASRCVQPASR